MKKIVTIGGATRDIFIQYEKPEMVHLHTKTGKRSLLVLEEGRKIEVKNLSYHTGGGATNSAVSFKRLGFDVSSFFKVGDDWDGKSIIQELERETVATRSVVYTTESKTGTSFIIPTAGGDRTVLVFRGANLLVKEDELPIDEIKASDQLYITSLSGQASQLLLPITRRAKENNKPVAVNPGTSQLVAGADILRDSLSYIDILILNCFEAKQCMLSFILTSKQLHSKVLKTRKHPVKKKGPLLLQSPLTYGEICFDLSLYFQEVLSRGSKIAVVTNGAEGVYVATEDTILFHSSLSVDIVNTLGAGDAFGSCFVASLVQGRLLEDAIRCGIINSASVISYLNAKDGLLTKEILEEKLDVIDKNLIQVFPLKE